MTMSSIFGNGDSFNHLHTLAAETGAPEFSGAWSIVELQPDVFVPQRFAVGVLVQEPGERIHFKLLDEYGKFECVYGERFPPRMIRELMAYAERSLRSAVQSKSQIPEIGFDTASLHLTEPQYTSGASVEATVERLFSELVVMAAEEKSSEGKKFESVDTVHARRMVNEELRRIAAMDYDKIAVESESGVLISDAGATRFLDINLLTPRACGSVISAVYKSPVSVELNLLKSSRDLTTYARINRSSGVGLFLLLPDEDILSPKQYGRIQDVIDDQSWKLERDGFRVTGFPSPHELAQDIYEWALPTL